MKQYGLSVQEHKSPEEHVPHTSFHLCPTAPHWASLAHLPENPEDQEMQDGQHLLLSSLACVFCIRLVCQPGMQPLHQLSVGLSRQGEHFTGHLRCYGLTLHLHGHR